MKRILISLSIIGAVAAIGIGATIAYLNDVETSTGNILIAGTMNLKVDHTLSFYNGLFCLNGVLVEQCDLGNLVKNGGFEVPEVTSPQKWDIFPSGTPGLDWQVKWRADVPATWNGHPRPAPALREYQEGAVGPAQEGDQLAELDTDWFGPGSSISGEPGAIHLYQSIPTIPGRQYTLSFWYSPRPGNNADDNKFDINWDGALLQSFNPGASSVMNWQNYTATVTASSFSTILEFVDRGDAGTGGDSLGAFLDNVQLIAINCPTDNPVLGNSCADVFGERDITSEKYFNFEDMKPGDYGRNIISMHVYNNDAWACLIIGNKNDNENVLIDPEKPTDITPAVGELSKYLMLFAWRDDNNNGIYEPPTETAIGTYTLGTNLVDKLPVFDSQTGTGPLIASNLKFVGLAWCVGTINVDGGTGAISCNGSGNQDDAQTDIFTASLTAYAEQWRNNAGFQCANVVLP